MPDLDVPTTMSVQAAAYRDRIRQRLPSGWAFEPLMTCFLTDETDPTDVAQGFAEGVLTAVKMYPARSTTNSAAGVTNARRVCPVLERMQTIGMRSWSMARWATAKWMSSTGRRHSLAGCLFSCEPISRRSGSSWSTSRPPKPWTMCRTPRVQSAPHLIQDKESACGCAGIFTAPVALELYTQVFEEERALDRLEAFASLNGARFYGPLPNTGTVTLVQSPWQPPELLPVGEADHVRVCSARRAKLVVACSNRRPERA